MKSTVKFLLLSCLFVALFSCSKSEPDSISITNEGVGISAVEVPNNSTPLSLSINSNVPWTATLSSSTSGFVVSPLSGKAGATVMSISAKPNNTGKDRVCDINFMAGSATATISLTQKSLVFRITPDVIELGYEQGSSATAQITCNTDWIIDTGIPNWLTVSPMQGSGNSTITITAQANAIKSVRDAVVMGKYAGSSGFSSFIVKQQGAPNNAPAKPVIEAPANGATDVATAPQVKWSKCTDPDVDDQVNYIVYYSTDQASWKKINVEKNNYCNFINYGHTLGENTKYYLKVAATDGYEGGTTESDIISFTTGKSTAYADGGYTVYMESSKSKPVRLVFTGDGYTASDFVYGGKFDSDLNEAIEGLFSIEPYKSYREYFTVYKLAAYSKESGITIKSENKKRDTFYKTVISGGGTTAVECAVEKVWAQVQKIPGFTEADLNNSPVCMMLNENYYAGTCYTAIDNIGSKSVAMCPALKNHQSGVDIPKIVLHEYGGHGFGRLADEYQYEGTITTDAKANLEAWQGYGWFKNVYATNDKDSAPWSKFFGIDGYSHVGWFQGAYTYQYGVWRSEYVSCMWDNRLYYNSQSRYMIVDRILSIAGEQITLEGFIAKDVQKTDNTSSSNNTKANYVEKFIPLGEPIMVMNK